MNIKINFLLICFFFSVFLFAQIDENSDSDKVTFHGAGKAAPIKVIISRPVTKFGNTVLKDKWLLLLCENYLNFRLRGIESLQVVSPEVLSASLKNYARFQNPVTLKEYVDAAENLLVPYVVYIQCEYYSFTSGMQLNIGDDINFFGKLIAIDLDTTLAVVAEQFPLKKLGSKLDKFIENVITQMDVRVIETNRQFLKTKIISTNDKKMRKLGEILEDGLEIENLKWRKYYSRLKNLLKREPEMLVGYYAGAKMCEAEKKYEDGITLYKQLLDGLEIMYPPTYIGLSRLYRLSGDYDAAFRILKAAPKSTLIEQDIERERGLLYKKTGKW